MIPTLAGIHHVKLPVTDLDRSINWYASRLGYQQHVEFRTRGRRTGVGMMHPNGGPMVGFVLNPELARAAAGFDYFSIGVPDKEALEALAAHLTALGEDHAGVHFATAGWILPLLHDPDGHEVRFYTITSHTDISPAHPVVMDDPVETSEAREAAYLAGLDQAKLDQAKPNTGGKTTTTMAAQAP